MRRNIFLIGVLLVSISLNINAQLTKMWHYKYPLENGGFDINNFFINTDGSVFATATVSGVANNFFNRYFIVKIDSSGNTLWTKQMDGVTPSSHDKMTSAAINTFSEIAVSGTSDWRRDFIAPVKLNANGDIVWRNILPPIIGADTLGGARSDKILIDSLGNTFITGDNKDTLKLFKFDSFGNEIFKTPLRFQGMCNDMLLDPSGNIYIGGDVMIGSGVNAIRNILLMKVNDSGSIVWDTTIDKGPDFMYHRIEKMIQYDDRILTLTSRYNGNKRVEILLFDTMGNYLWNSTDTMNYFSHVAGMGIADDNSIFFGASYRKNADSNIVVLNKIDWMGNHICVITDYGYKRNYHHLATDKQSNLYTLINDDGTQYIAKYGSGCALIWKYPLSNDVNNLISYSSGSAYFMPFNNNLIFDKDQFLYIYGRTSFKDSVTNIWTQTLHVIKYQVDSISSINPLNISSSHVHFYPNPSGNNIQIQSSQKIHSYTITDLSGKVLEQKKRIKNSETIMLNVSAYPQGMYLCEVVFENSEREVKKFVVGR